jgi:hypothetical protein
MWDTEGTSGTPPHECGSWDQPLANTPERVAGRKALRSGVFSVHIGSDMWSFRRRRARHMTQPITLSQYLQLWARDEQRPETKTGDPLAATCRWCRLAGTVPAGKTRHKGVMWCHTHDGTWA